MAFCEKNYIFKKIFLLSFLIWFALFSILFMYEPLFYFTFLFLLLISGGGITTQRKKTKLRSFMYGIYYAAFTTLISNASLLWLLK